MRFVGYVLKTKGYYITLVILTAIYTVVSFSFSDAWKRTNETLETFNSFSATIIAYDAVPDTKDSFANFERNAVVSLTGAEGESVNVFVYQFLEGVQYSDKSIINRQNVIYGDFDVLEVNEIAVSDVIARKNDLNIGDVVYVNEKPCQLKYIYRNVYQVYDVNFSISQTVVFVGINTVKNMSAVNYCNFDPAETVHQSLKNINQVRKMLTAQEIIYWISVFVMLVFSTIIMALFRRKEEIRAFKKYLYFGGKRLKSLIFIIEFMFVLPCALISVMFGFLLGFPISLLLALCVAIISGWSYNSLSLLIGVLR